MLAVAAYPLASSPSGMSMPFSWTVCSKAGRVVLGGPYADFSRALVIVEARDIQEVSSLFSHDPWEKEGILTPGEIIEWTIFLDSRRNHK